MLSAMQLAAKILSLLFAPGAKAVIDSLLTFIGAFTGFGKDDASTAREGVTIRDTGETFSIVNEPVFVTTIATVTFCPIITSGGSVISSDLRPLDEDIVPTVNSVTFTVPNVEITLTS